MATKEVPQTVGSEDLPNPGHMAEGFSISYSLEPKKARVGERGNPSGGESIATWVRWDARPVGQTKRLAAWVLLGVQGCILVQSGWCP